MSVPKTSFELLRLKGAAKLYFTHYSRVVIILSNTGLSKSAFSTDSFGNLVYCFSTVYPLCQVEFNVTFRNFKTFAFIINADLSIRYSVFLFSLISKKCHKHWSIAFNKRKHVSRELFELLYVQNSIYKVKC